MHLGDYQAGATIPVVFNTYGSNGESLTMTGLAVTDIEIYKGANITAGNERTSDSGYTLIDTDGIDVDGITGVHGFTIDTSDNSVAGWWVRNEIYHVIINSITVNAQTVRMSYSFTIEMDPPRDGTLRGEIATYTSNTSWTGASGETGADDDMYNGYRVKVVAKEVAEREKEYTGIVTDYVGSTRTFTIAVTQGSFTAAASDIFYLTPPQSLDLEQTLPSTATADTTGDALKQATREITAKKNTALNNTYIYLVQSTDHVTPLTGATPTVEISQDGGAFAAMNGSSAIAEISDGFYQLDLVASDMNADTLAIKVTATGGDPVGLTISTVE